VLHIDVQAAFDGLQGFSFASLMRADRIHHDFYWCLIMLVVEWLEEVGCFCERTMYLDSRVDNGSCEMTPNLEWKKNC
jgi:hypothetical protein